MPEVLPASISGWVQSRRPLAEQISAASAYVLPPWHPRSNFVSYFCIDTLAPFLLQHLTCINFPSGVHRGGTDARWSGLPAMVMRQPSAVGTSLGERVGESVGTSVGVRVGTSVGASVGVWRRRCAVGSSVGDGVGDGDGSSVGAAVGERVGGSVGFRVGDGVGDGDDGAGLGCAVIGAAQDARRGRFGQQRVGV